MLTLQDLKAMDVYKLDKLIAAELNMKRTDHYPYCLDMDMALRLISDMDNFTLSRSILIPARQWEACITVGQGDTQVCYMSQDFSPARAICEAWLLWRQVQP